MLKTTLLKVFARDLAKVISFIKAIEDHIEALIVKERAKLAFIGDDIAQVRNKAAIKIAKLEDEALDTERTIAIAVGLKKAATSATTQA